MTGEWMNERKMTDDSIEQSLSFMECVYKYNNNVYILYNKRSAPVLQFMFLFVR